MFAIAVWIFVAGYTLFYVGACKWNGGDLGFVDAFKCKECTGSASSTPTSGGTPTPTPTPDPQTQPNPTPNPPKTSPLPQLPIQTHPIPGGGLTL